LVTYNNNHLYPYIHLTILHISIEYELEKKRIPIKNIFT